MLHRIFAAPISYFLYWNFSFCCVLAGRGIVPQCVGSRWIQSRDFCISLFVVSSTYKNHRFTENSLFTKLYEQAEIFCLNPPASTLQFNSSTPANTQKIEKNRYRKCNIGASKNAVTHFLRRDDFYIFYIGFFLFSSVCYLMN